MGGNPDSAGPKMTKLQALAAARKKNALEQKNNAGASDVTKPMAGLSLGAKSGSDVSKAGGPASASPSGSHTTSGKENVRKYSGLKRKDSSPHKQESRPPASVVETPSPPPIEPIPEVEAAAPSAFAATMFGDNPLSLRQASAAAFTLPYSDPHLQPTDDAFAGPSPDDQVLAAQSKGSAQPAIPRRS